MERLLCTRLLAEGFVCLYQYLNPGLAVNSISALNLSCAGFMGGAQSRSRMSLACLGQWLGKAGSESILCLVYSLAFLAVAAATLLMET